MAEQIKTKIADTSGQDVVLTKPSNYRKQMIVGFVTTTILFGLFSINRLTQDVRQADQTVSAKRLRLAQVTKGDFLRDLSVQGRIVAAVSPRLYSPAQGTITFQVAAGDSVQQGQILAEIESPELTNELKREQASLQELEMESVRRSILAKKLALENQKAVDMAKIVQTAADREKRRADRAYQTNSISQIDFEKAQDELESAKLEFKHAELDARLSEEGENYEMQAIQLKVERQRLLVTELTRQNEQLILRSPVSGIVGNLAVKQKEQVGRNQAILSVVDLSEFELEISIPETYADDLQIGMEAEVKFNNENYPARLVTLSPEIEQNQVVGRVRFERNSQGTSLAPRGLRQNQRLTTRVLLENKPNVVMVQRGQFLQSNNGHYAYKVTNNLAQRIKIQSGSRSLSSVEIISGLAVGDTIIISDTSSFGTAKNIYIAE